MSSAYELLTSTRYDEYLLSLSWNNDNDEPSPFLLLPFHFDRLIDACAVHGWADAQASLSYTSLKASCQNAVSSYEPPDTGPKVLKLRITLSQSGVLTIHASPAQNFTADPTAATFFNPTTDNPSLYGPVFKVYLDSQPTPSSVFTSTKTTQRVAYNEARSRFSITPITPNTDPTTIPTEVILYNEHNHITEASISNVAFFQTYRWVTPPASSGCLSGVLRRWLLQEGRVQEAEEGMLRKDGIKDGDWVLLFNGVQGCQLGRVASQSC